MWVIKWYRKILLKENSMSTVAEEKVDVVLEQPQLLSLPRKLQSKETETTSTSHTTIDLASDTSNISNEQTQQISMNGGHDDASDVVIPETQDPEEN